VTLAFFGSNSYEGLANFGEEDVLYQLLQENRDFVSSVVSSQYSFPDKHAAIAAKKLGIPVQEIEPDPQYKGADGFRRVKIACSLAHKILIFWDGVSQGTEKLLPIVERSGKPYKIIKFNKEILNERPVENEYQ
jgi:hypothetical protein